MASLLGDTSMSLPTKVYYVETEKHEDEPVRYYSTSTKRMYGSMVGVTAFIKAHPKRKHRIWSITEPQWELENDIKY